MASNACMLWEHQVRATVIEALGTLDFRSKKDHPCRLNGFLMMVQHQYDQWPEQSRRRQWVSFADAYRLLDSHRPELVEMVVRAQNRIARSPVGRKASFTRV
jgi:hypothetical protein